MHNLECLASTRCFGGRQARYRHHSKINQCEMTFGIFVPEAAKIDTLPVVYWLSGLTCTDENFMQKSGAQRFAAELGLILVAPDTSPRGEQVPDDPEGGWDFGLGAGFYVNATQSPWQAHYQMFDYVNCELPALVEAEFPTNGLRSICGHSMGGHGALISALHFPTSYRSVSAFAPIVHPSVCPWGIKAFTHYLGDKEANWQDYDACELIKSRGLKLPALVDQGEDDEFLEEQLRIEDLETLVSTTDTDIKINRRPGYDHSYYFIASFIEQHLAFHAAHLFPTGG